MVACHSSRGAGHLEAAASWRGVMRSPHRQLEDGAPGQLAQVHPGDHLLKAVAACVGRLLIQLPVNLRSALTLAGTAGLGIAWPLSCVI